MQRNWWSSLSVSLFQSMTMVRNSGRPASPALLRGVEARTLPTVSNSGPKPLHWITALVTLIIPLAVEGHMEPGGEEYGEFHPPPSGVVTVTGAPSLP